MSLSIVKIIQMILDTTPFVEKHNNKMNIKSNNTNTIVIKNNSFVDKSKMFNKQNSHFQPFYFSF